MPIHVVARGALIGGGVGAALAAVRGGKAKGEGTGSEVVRFAKSIAEGALAGAGVGLLLDRRLRARAGELVAEHGPSVLEAAGDFAEVAASRAVEAYESARPAVAHALEAARPTVVHAFELAAPAVSHAIGAARPAVAGAVAAANPAVTAAAPVVASAVAAARRRAA